MVVIKHKRKKGLHYGIKTLLAKLSDRWLLASIAVLVFGILLFNISAASPRQVLQKYATGGSAFTLKPGENASFKFGTPYNQATTISFTLGSGTVLNYSVYNYVVVTDLTYGYGKTYYQNEVMHGTADYSTNMSIPVQPVDMTYFINISNEGSTVRNVTVYSYAEFYQLQPFQYPEEIAGVVSIAAGLLLLAIRITTLNESL